MSDAGSSPVAIELIDKIPSSISAKLQTIAADARVADEAVERLQAQLSGLDRASKATANAARAADLNAQSQTKAAVAADKVALSTARLEKAQAQAALAVSRAGIAYANQEAALSRAILAEDRATKATVDKTAAMIADARATEAAAAWQAEYNRIAASQGIITVTKGSARSSAQTFIDDAKAQQQSAVAASALTAATVEQDTARLRAIKNIEYEAATFGKSRAEVLAFRAAQAGVAAEAAPFIEKIAASEKAVHKFSLANSGSVREMLVLGREFARGDTTRMAGSFTLLAQRSGLLEMALSPIGLTIVGITLAMAGFVVAAVAGENELSKIRNELKATNDYAGLTDDGFIKLAKTIAGEANTSFNRANGALAALVSSGKMSGDTLKYLGVSAVLLSQQTGESADKIAADFVKMSDGVTKYAIDFNSTHHELTAAQVDYIRTLEQRGEKEKAQLELSKDIYNGLKNNAVQNLGLIQKAWTDLGNNAAGVWERLKGFMRDATLDEKLAAAENNLKLEQQLVNQMGANAPKADVDAVARYSMQVEALKTLAAARDDDAAAQSAWDKEQQNGIEASSRLNGEWLTYAKNADAAGDAIKRFRKDLDAALLANPNDKKALEDKANQAAVEARIRKAFDPVGVANDNKAAAAAERRSVSLQKLNVTLDNQLAILKSIDPENEAQKQFDQIEEQMIGKRIKLTDDEVTAIKRKIAAISEQKRENDISTQIRQIQDHTTNLKLNTREREIQQQLDAVDDAEFAKGRGRFSEAQLNRMRQALQLQKSINDATAIYDANESKGREAGSSALLASIGTDPNSARAQLDFSIEQIQDYYDTIASMRALNAQDAEDKARAIAQVELKYNSTKLDNANTFFGLLADLQNSSNKKVAAIGKAAAIAKATMDGYVAINAALIGPPGPPWSFAIAGATGAIVAANIASIAGIKFADGGMISGPGGPRDDRVPILASHGEFIVNADSTRKHRALLQAINDNNLVLPKFNAGGVVNNYIPQGYTQPAANVNVQMPRIVVENHGTPQTYTMAYATKDEVRMIAKDVLQREGPKMNEAEISNPNSRTSKALKSSTQTVRRH